MPKTTAEISIWTTVITIISLINDHSSDSKEDSVFVKLSHPLNQK